MRTIAAFVLAGVLVFAAPAAHGRAADGAATHGGFLADGARYLIDIPPAWNGTLLLYSHGYITRGTESGVTDAPDARTKDWLLQHGFALAASSYAAQGWAVAEALADQIDVLDRFDQLSDSRPRRTIAWGHSMGGLISAALVEHNPARFSGALPMCGVLAGTAPFLSTRLDLLYAFTTLLAPEAALPVARIADPQAAGNVALDLLERAQTTPAGRARIALAATLAGIPEWYGRAAPEPAAGDLDARELAQYYWLKTVGVSVFSFDIAAELEMRAGGLPFTNAGVDYAQIFERAPGRASVRAQYARAGLNLASDLRALAAGSRIDATDAAARYAHRFADLSGRVTVPVLTMHTVGDGLVPADNETAYAAAAAAAGSAAYVRELFVHRSSHCGFTPAETLAALQALLARIDGGRWDARQSPARLNDAAAAFGPDLNRFGGQSGGSATTPPAFIPFDPPPFTR
ncbi:MAG: prolyl oligopeptidase family serine peptidase [Candidatus Velthaea sp.]